MIESFLIFLDFLETAFALLVFLLDLRFYFFNDCSDSSLFIPLRTFNSNGKFIILSILPNSS